MDAIQPKLRLYYVDDEYTDLLRLHGDHNVLNHVSATYVHKRVYVGPFYIDNYVYYAPFSSIKTTDFVNYDNEDTPKESSVFVHRIMGNDGRLFTKIKFSHMLPVPDDFVTEINIRTIDAKPNYLNKLAFMAWYIKQNKFDLNERALAIYSKKLDNVQHPNIINFPRLNFLYNQTCRVPDLFNDR